MTKEPMEIKQNFTLYLTRGEHTFTFTMPNGATWGAAIDASFDILNHLGKLSQQAIENAQPKKEGESNG